MCFEWEQFFFIFLFFFSKVNLQILKFHREFSIFSKKLLKKKKKNKKISLEHKGLKPKL